jgi:DNA repair protein RAD5
VVFSQFTSFLDLIETALRRENFDQYRFDGSMDVKRRNESVSDFKSPSNKPKILIVSLKAGGKFLYALPLHIFDPVSRRWAKFNGS